VSVRIDVPDGGRWFAGHLPGRPILPGVAQLHFIVDAIRRAHTGMGPLAGIRHARLRRLIAPGETLELTSKAGEGGLIQATLTRAGTPVTQATLVFGTLPPPPRASESFLVSGPDVEAAPLDALIPQRPPMRFVTGLVAERPDGLVCAACIPADCALVSGSSAPALAAIEAAAQTAAAWEALRRADGAAGARIGYIVALRDIALFSETIGAAKPLLASVRLEGAAMPLTRYAAEVAGEGAILMHGTITTYLTDTSAS